MSKYMLNATSPSGNKATTMMGHFFVRMPTNKSKLPTRSAMNVVYGFKRHSSFYTRRFPDSVKS